MSKVYVALWFALVLALGACGLEKGGEAPKAPSSGAAVARPRPSKVILGYSSTANDARWPPESYDYGELTHVTRCFLPVKEDGSMPQASIFDPKLTELAKKNGVKLLAALGGWMGENGHEPWLKMARDPNARQRFLDNLEKIITAQGYDGIDIDWEPLAPDGMKEPELRALQKTYTELMVALRARFPKWIITTAMGISPNNFKYIGWPELLASVDFVNLMAYDLAGSWTKHAAHNANLYATTDFVNKDDLDIHANVRALLETYRVPPGKLLLGVPFYGKQFTTEKMGQPVLPNVLHPGEPILYADAAPLAASGDYKKLWDNGAHVSYLEKNGGSHTVSYDDERTIAEKCSYAKEKGFAGVFTWALGQDLYAGRPVLLDVMAQAMGVPPADPPLDYLKKYYETRISDAKKLSQEIVKAQGELVRLDKGKQHKLWDPLQAFSGLGSSKSDRKEVEAQIQKAEKLAYVLKSKMEEVDTLLDAIPLSYRAGRAIKAEGPALLVSDFEDGSIAHKLGGSWEAELDQNKLGTTLSPNPLKVTGGGYKGSRNCLRFFGHFGRSGAAPWPYADIGASMPSSDLSEFKGLRFAARGNGRRYAVVIRRGTVRDYGHFRAQFAAPAEWNQVELKFDDFAQPDWAHPVRRGWVDVVSIAFMPDASFNDEDYDLSIDNVELVRSQ